MYCYYHGILELFLKARKWEKNNPAIQFAYVSTHHVSK